MTENNIVTVQLSCYKEDETFSNTEVTATLPEGFRPAATVTSVVYIAPGNLVSPNTRGIALVICSPAGACKCLPYPSASASGRT